MSIKNLFIARDMTQGTPWKRIMEFAVPMLLGNLAQQLYNAADSVIVGRYVGDNALAAVGSAAPILNLLLALFVGISTGADIVISQSYGAKDRGSLSKNIGNCITLAAISTVIIMLIGPLITRPMLEMLGTPERIIAWCTEYLNIYFVGIIGFFFYNMLSGILRGLGDSISALLFLLVSAALNVVLDLWFVICFDMGVPGVALATAIAQAISAVLCYWRLMRMRDVFDLSWKHLKLTRKHALRILKLGLPSGITQAIMSTGSMVVQSLTNSMGEEVIACSVIIMRVDGFAVLPNMTFGQAMSVYTGQNVGSGKFDRVDKGAKQGGILALVFAVFITTALLLFGRYLFAIFTTTESLIDLAVRMMQILAFGYLAIAVTQVLGGIMRGAGDTMTPMWISICSTILLRVPIAYALAYLTRTANYPNGQPKALYFALLISVSLGALTSLIAYRKGNWRRVMVHSAELARAQAIASDVEH